MLSKRFPFLLPLRQAQRRAIFYAKLQFDGHTYAHTLQAERLPQTLFAAGSGLYNPHTGFDMVYQHNKVFNLKLAVKTMNGLLINPGESFSFWQTVRGADRYTAYKQGLVVKNGVLSTAYGGGLCQMSNFLFWLFLHSPLTIIERHTHMVKDFPTQRSVEPEGVDATVSEGWLDLKVKNNTSYTFQLDFSFTKDELRGRLLSDTPLPFTYGIEGRGLRYYRENGEIRQQICVYRQEYEKQTGALYKDELLYTNDCVVGYPLPAETVIDDGRRLTICNG